MAVEPERFLKEVKRLCKDLKDNEEAYRLCQIAEGYATLAYIEDAYYQDLFPEVCLTSSARYLQKLYEEFHIEKARKLYEEAKDDTWIDTIQEWIEEDKKELKELLTPRRLSNEEVSSLKKFIEDNADAFKEMLESTEKDGIERGFLICRDKVGNLSIGKSCVGDRCSITLEDCKNKEVIGSFHTHPPSIEYTLPSFGDILNVFIRGQSVTCIGSSAKGKIACYEPAPDQELISLALARHKVRSALRGTYFDVYKPTSRSFLTDIELSCMLDSVADMLRKNPPPTRSYRKLFELSLQD